MSSPCPWQQPLKSDSAFRGVPEDFGTSSSGALQAEMPLRLHLTGSASGGPDLRLQLLSVKYGTACQHIPRPLPDHRNTWMGGMCLYCRQYTYAR